MAWKTCLGLGLIGLILNTTNISKIPLNFNKYGVKPATENQINYGDIGRGMILGAGICGSFSLKKYFKKSMKKKEINLIPLKASH